MKRFLLLVAFLAAVLPSALSAADFEGTVHMKVTSNKKPSTIDYQVKTGFVRTNVTTGKGEIATIIMDTAKGTMTILIPGQKMYLTRPIPAAQPRDDAPTAPAGGNRPLVQTGQTETVLGYTCTKYISPSANGDTVELWVTSDLGNFAGFGGGMGAGGGGRQSSNQEWAKLVQGQGFFPMRVITKDSAGNEKNRMEVTGVDKGPLPADTFSPPAGYQELNMGQMTGQGFGRP